MAARGVTKVLSLAVLSALLFAGTGCRKEWALLEGFQAKLDPELAPEERKALESAARRLVELKYESREVGATSLYDLIFPGENRNLGVLKYLDERVNYIFSQNTDAESLLKLKRRELDGTSGGAILMATNIGTAIFLQSELVGPEFGLALKMEGRKIPVTGSRIGLIQLGPGFSKPGLTAVEQLSTLVHEGRHSDCTGGLYRSDIARLRLGILPSKSVCGNFHTVCPDGHRLAGLPACEAHPYGAYFVQSVFDINLSGNCANCSEDEKQLALLSGFDGLSRLEPPVLTAILAGAFGLPDMSSQGVIED
jgi:hypothetical protein